MINLAAVGVIIGSSPQHIVGTMRKYRLLAKKGEGTFSQVVKAQNIKTGTFHAIKCMKSSYTDKEQVNNLREIQAIKRLGGHPNIVKLDEVLFDSPSGRLALVFELQEGNLYELMKDSRKRLGDATVKSFMRQIFKALKHLHEKGIFHRDIKPENILVDKQGRHLKLADFGSCRGIHSKPPFTEYISTRWYRPPECLMTSGMYGAEMDVWAAGCIQFELSTLVPLFPGTDEPDQVDRIHKVLGMPDASVVDKLRRHASPHANFSFPKQSGLGLSKLLPDATENFLDLLQQSIAYDKDERITSKRALGHAYFVGEHPLPPPKSNKTSSASTNRSNKASKEENQLHRRTAKKVVAPTSLPSSYSFPSYHSTAADHTSTMAEADQASGPVAPPKQSKVVAAEDEKTPQLTKPRSMVSILLARNNKKEFIQESKARNNTFNRKRHSKKDRSHGGADRTNLPKLKSLVNKGNSSTSTDSTTARSNNASFRKHTRAKRYANIQSSGYGGKVAPTPAPDDTTHTKLPSLNDHTSTNKSKRAGRTTTKTRTKGVRTKRLLLESRRKS